MTPAGAGDRRSGGVPGRAERAVIWMLYRLLPEGFRARQRAEWTGDLIAMSAGGASARWRYLFAAAWTLPALRAHAHKAGVDHPHTMVPPAVSVTTLVRVILVGLGAPVMAWLIAVPTRYVLLDVPARFASSNTEHPVAFDPKDLWPMEGPFVVLVPLWVALSLGAWALILGWMLFTWVGLVAAVLGPTQRGAGLKHRVITGLLGVAIVALASLLGGVGRMLGLVQVSYFSMDKGLTAAVMGAISIVVGVGARGLTWRRRAAVLAVGLTAIAIFVWHHTTIGEAMLSWYLD